MAFAVVPHTITANDADQRFKSAIKYLRKSKMAASIIDELSALQQVITIRIGPGLEDKYIHPKVDDDITGGIIEWDPEANLDVIDKAKYRPKVGWVKDKKKKKNSVDVPGTISANVALAHEMGHAYQFFGDKQGYYEAISGEEKLWKHHEDHLVAAIENTVVVELRKKGHKEGIRWDYYHTR